MRVQKLGSSQRNIKRARSPAICPRGTDTPRPVCSDRPGPANVGKWGRLNSPPRKRPVATSRSGARRAPFPDDCQLTDGTGDQALCVSANERP